MGMRRGVRQAERAYPAGGPFSLGDAARLFFHHTSPRTISAALILVTVGRLRLRRFRAAELVVPALIVAAQPLTEWLVHVHLLHLRPRRWAGRTIDPLVSRKHRAHHADPKRLDLVWIPMPALLGLLGGTAGAALLTQPPAAGLTALGGIYGMTLTYEWTHFLIHSPYRPRGRPYRYIWRAHRNHHYRNENYWFGVTSPLADHLLGTFPDRSEVPLSPTAQDLEKALLAI